MPIEFNCPHCLQGYKVADSKLGKRVRCKTCGEVITVPDTSGLSFVDDTREMKRPKGRASSTKILPADRPKRKQQVHSETVKLKDKPPPKSPPAKPEPAKPAPPKGKLPGGRMPSNLKEPPALPKGTRAPGTSRPLPEAPKKRRLNLIFLLGSLAMIVGFFLPCFTPNLADFNQAVFAFQLPLVADKIAIALDRAGVYAKVPLVETLRNHADYKLALFALYLTPVLALYAAIDELRCAGKGKSHWWLRILAALSPALALGVLYAIFRDGLQGVTLETFGPLDQSATLAALGPGAYTLTGGLLFALLGVVIAPKMKKPKTPELPPKPAGAGPTRPKLPTPRKPE